MIHLALLSVGFALGVVITLSLAFYLHLKDPKMALNFTALQTQASAVGTNATALQAQAAASDDASNQAAIDAVTATLSTANATLASLLPAPVVEPVPEQPAS